MSKNSSQSNVTQNQNQTFSSTPAPSTIDSSLFVQILTYVDYVNRVLSMIIFFTYFMLILKLKFMRHKSLIYVHHSNFVGFLFCLMYIFYFTTTAPNLPNQYLNLIFCVMSEVTWSMLKYLRSYSILLIAIYRFAAVFHINQFKKLNSSYCALLLPILVLWLLSLIFFLSTKFGFKTTYGSLFCIDGNAISLSDRINYLIVTSILSILIPFTSITLIYCLIKIKLSQTETNLNQQKLGVRKSSSIGANVIAIELSNSQEMSQTGATTSNTKTGAEKTLKMKTYELKKTQRLNQQLIALNICYFMAFLVSFVLNFRYIIPDFNQRFYYFRQLLRILNVFFQSMIPVLSLYFNPHLNHRIKKVFAKKAYLDRPRNLIIT